jgi:hypothetical protein
MYTLDCMHKACMQTLLPRAYQVVTYPTIKAIQHMQKQPQAIDSEIEAKIVIMHARPTHPLLTLLVESTVVTAR